jgi:hypothetical protein
MRRLLRSGSAALGAGLLGIGLAASAASPASAATYVTPKYGMTCTTGVTGSFGSYQGYATCFTPVVAKWKVSVSCSFGFTYDSIIVYTSDSDGWYTLSPAPTCYWGVDSVSVIELD